MINRYLKRFFLASIFLLPLISANNLFGYEQIKVLFFILNISLIGFLWLFQKPKLEWNLIRLTSFLFIFALFISSGLGIDIKNSILGTDPYYQGLIVYGYLFVFSLIVATTRLNLTSYATVLTASSLVVSAVALQDWILKNIFNLNIPNYAGRVVSTFGQPNFFAGFLLLTLPFSYFLLKNHNKKLQLLGWGSGVISFIGIIVSYSRSAILLSLILLSLALIYELKIKKLAILIFVMILGAFFLSVNFSSGLWWSEWVQPQNNKWLIDNSPEKRVFIWPVVVELIKIKPAVGYGLENIAPAFSQYFIDNKHALFEENLNVQPALLSLKDLNLDRTHNYILDLFLFSGVLGIVAYLILLVVLLVKKKNKTILVGLITYLIWVQFQNQSLVHLFYFWLIVGLVDSNT